MFTEAQKERLVQAVEELARAGTGKAMSLAKLVTIGAALGKASDKSVFEHLFGAQK